MPEDLCGLPVEQETFEPLFPPGGELAVKKSFSDHARTSLLVGARCLIEVDGERVIESGTTGYDGFDRALFNLGSELAVEDGRDVPGEFNARVWPGLALAQAPCTVSMSPGHNEMESFLVYLQVAHPKNEEQAVEVLSDVIQPYMAAAIEGVPCAEREGSGG
ncbi:hypothetical protein [Streptomyces carpaticus]|uniref:Uncharacterized protein n=1 Tax=Streptomyces carpaticus TaxID=285558 RepID=A0ABV4ZH80_9ACTN